MYSIAKARSTNKKNRRRSRKAMDKKARYRKLLEAYEEGKYPLDIAESNYPNIADSPSSESDIEQYVPNIFAAERSPMCGSLNEGAATTTSRAKIVATKGGTKLVEPTSVHNDAPIITEKPSIGKKRKKNNSSKIEPVSKAGPIAPIVTESQQAKPSGKKTKGNSYKTELKGKPEQTDVNSSPPHVTESLTKWDTQSGKKSKKSKRKCQVATPMEPDAVLTAIQEIQPSETSAPIEVAKVTHTVKATKLRRMSVLDSQLSDDSLPKPWTESLTKWDTQSGKKSKKIKRKCPVATPMEPDAVLTAIQEIQPSETSTPIEVAKVTHSVKATKLRRMSVLDSPLSVIDSQMSVLDSQMSDDSVPKSLTESLITDKSFRSPDLSHKVSLSGTEEQVSEDDTKNIEIEGTEEESVPYFSVTLNPDDDSVPDIGDILNLKVNKQPKHNKLDAELKFIADEERSVIQKKLDVHIFDPLCIFVLKHPMTVYLHGKAKMKVIAGAVKMFGHTLDRNKSYNVFAPIHSHCLDFETLENEQENCDVMVRLTDMGCSLVKARNIIAQLKPNDAIVCLQALNNREYDFIQEVYNKNHLFVTSKTDDPILNQAAAILQCSLYISNPPKVFKKDPEWQQLLNSEEYDLNKVVICGGKNFGKSTYLRYHVNALLKEHENVLVLDLDPGQCEFTVAGNISATVVNEPLFGPNFTHLKKPDLLLHLAMVNVMDSIPRYLNGVMQLIQYCSNYPKYHEMPWVINTMGMTNEYGVKIMIFILQCLQPTLLIQFAENNRSEEFDLVRSPVKVKEFLDANCATEPLFEHLLCTELNYKTVVHIVRAVAEKTSISPSKLRLLNYIAYFSKLLQLHPATGFLGITPYEISLKDLHLITSVPTYQLEITKILNGKIVALGTYSNEDIFNTSDAIVMKQEALSCIGFGLVRAVDCLASEAGKVYVLTPVALADLIKVNAIVYMDCAPELTVTPQLGIFTPHRMPPSSDTQLLMPPARRFNPIQMLRTAAFC